MTSPTNGPIRVSVIIHTLNEEVNISYALESVCRNFAEVFVVDAGSTDNTVLIAESFGAKVIRIKGDRSTLVAQRNWALENLPFSFEWIYILDADESVPADLAHEIRDTVESAEPRLDGYWVRYREIVFGRWCRRSSIYPNWNLRLFRHKLGRYEQRKVNAHVLIDHTRTGYLKSHFVHDDRRGFSAYIKRLSQITVVEANSLDELYKANDQILAGRLWSRSPVERRRALKRIYYRLPFRPLIIFSYLYVVRMGFLEGKAGLYKCLYRACHELFVNMVRFDRESTSR